jgi:hypothetical protein
VIPERDISLIFTNIERIYEIHYEILTGLQSVHIVDYFAMEEHELIPFVDVLIQGTKKNIEDYCIYMAKHEASIKTMGQCLQNAIFAQFCRDTSCNPECHSLDLGSFLIKPVQRY